MAVNGSRCPFKLHSVLYCLQMKHGDSWTIILKKSSGQLAQLVMLLLSIYWTNSKQEPMGE